jgi:hypothetical protein
MTYCYIIRDKSEEKLELYGDYTLYGHFKQHNIRCEKIYTTSNTIDNLKLLLR